MNETRAKRRELIEAAGRKAMYETYRNKQEAIDSLESEVHRLQNIRANLQGELSEAKAAVSVEKSWVRRWHQAALEAMRERLELLEALINERDAWEDTMKNAQATGDDFLEGFARQRIAAIDTAITPKG